MLSESQKRILLDTARGAIRAAVRGMSGFQHQVTDTLLLSPGAAFVTLRIEGELRGCIGYIEPIRPLIETIEEVAVKAATEDFRFTPVEESELPHISIEISVLSRLEQVTDIQEIEVGKHGLLIEANNSRGLLLPQVASEQGWDRETFLNQTARKAGLPSAMWRNPQAKIFKFSAEIFNDTELIPTPGH